MRKIRHDAAMDMAFAKEKPKTEEAVYVAEDFDFETTDSEENGETKSTITHGKAGDYIVKGADGKKRVMHHAEFADKYDTRGIPEFRDHPSDINKLSGFHDDLADRKNKEAQLKDAKNEAQRPTKMEPQNIPDPPAGKPEGELSDAELEDRTKPENTF